jgi:integrase
LTLFSGRPQTVPTPALTQLPFTSAAQAWLESRRAYLSAKTYHEYELSIHTLSKFFGELRLPEIDGDLVRSYQRMRKGRIGDGAFAINHECGILLQMRKRIGLPLADYQPLPLPKQERGRALSDEQRSRLLRVAHANPNWEAAYLFAVISVNTSAGPKETSTLRLKDVDLGKGTIRIQPAGAKNVHRVRTIPLNDEALAGLVLAMARAKRLGSCEPEHYLFPFRVSTGHYDPSRFQTTFKTAWKKLIAAAQLPGFRMYDLRHHAITALLENPEVSEETAEDIAGHISRRIKKRYSHIRMKYKRAAVEAIAPQKSNARPRRSAKTNDRKKLVSQLTELLTKLLESA